MRINQVGTGKNNKHSINFIYNQHPFQYLGMRVLTCCLQAIKAITHLIPILPRQYREVHFKKIAKRDSNSTLCFLNNLQVKRCFYNHVL